MFFELRLGAPVIYRAARQFCNLRSVFMSSCSFECFRFHRDIRQGSEWCPYATWDNKDDQASLRHRAGKHIFLHQSENGQLVGTESST